MFLLSRYLLQTFPTFLRLLLYPLPILKVTRVRLRVLMNKENGRLQVGIHQLPTQKRNHPFLLVVHVLWQRPLETRLLLNRLGVVTVVRGALVARELTGPVSERELERTLRSWAEVG